MCVNQAEARRWRLHYHSYSLRSGYGPSSYPFASEGLNITVSIVIISIGS